MKGKVRMPRRLEINPQDYDIFAYAIENEPTIEVDEACIKLGETTVTIPLTADEATKLSKWLAGYAKWTASRDNR